MTNLTTPKATLIGLSLIAAAIATTPLTSSLVQPANAQNGITKVQICGTNYFKTWGCAAIANNTLAVQHFQ